tara:strand:+ start:3885 stop:4277 length:393 start_codon:yes stop_codon:yes gene_type:complete
MILKFKQKLCGKGYPMVDLNGTGYEDWDCFDGEIEYRIEFDAREYGIKDIIPSITSFRVHLEEMDGDKTETISVLDKDYLIADKISFLRDDKENDYDESWSQFGDALVNGLHISHIVLNTETKDIDVCMK